MPTLLIMMRLMLTMMTTIIIIVTVMVARVQGSAAVAVASTSGHRAR